MLGAGTKKIKHLANERRLQPQHQAELAALEDKIAGTAGLPKESVLVTPIFGQERFEGKDIMIYQGPGKKPASLKARYPAHFKNIEEVAQTYLAFRISTLEKYRKRLSNPNIARKVFNLVMDA